ncbi:MAG: PilZ domain-containing protein [Candidatus Aminicenantes bacterium]|nr:MAG: PilZ domain-containing protein [Candidatus Aminicenantes bacterium]
MKETEKREAKRIKEETKISITLLSKDLVPPGKTFSYNLTKDISSKGVKIRANTFLPINAALKIELSLKKPRRLISVLGKVRWIKTLYAGESFEMGIEFMEKSSEDIKILTRHIEDTAD